ncbi:MAG: PEP-CTERM sorting domain-containing protein [Deltaproteobacteria bacterium]|nr:PEP-CTERM sorting domain-containing protein [Deltaproteobacteria bacterium]
MKAKILSLCAILSVILFMVSAEAATTTFNFEDGESGLTSYMEEVFGGDLTVNNLTWYGNDTLFGSDAIATTGANPGRIDFDPLGRNESDYEILQISFQWAVYDETGKRDFGLDVYDDGIQNWRNNVFVVEGVGDGTTGTLSSLLFDAAWQVTRIQIHDSGLKDVGIDNLTIVDNRAGGGAPVPEPGTMLLLGAGLVGLAGYRRFAGK